MANETASPKISVVMATYNGGAYVQQQVESILAQHLPPDELIVCDDLSTDDTITILKQYEQKGLLRLVVNEQRLGIIRNFQKAAGLCKPDNYIAFSDQDDVWLTEKLKENAASLKSIDDGETPALTFSDVSLVNNQLVVTQPSFWKVLNITPARESISTLLFGNIITGCTVMINPAMRALFCAMPADNRVAMHDAWLGLIAFTFGRYKFIEKPLVLYRQHGANATYETNQEQTVMNRMRQAIGQFVDNSAYLKKEIEQAELFKETYGSRLTPEHSRVIDDFIRLGCASFLRKKYSSILARRYRYLKGNN